jgi:hypothetical protein
MWRAYDRDTPGACIRVNVPKDAATRSYCMLYLPPEVSLEVTTLNLPLFRLPGNGASESLGVRCKPQIADEDIPSKEVHQ